MKTCSRCRKERALSEFWISRKGRTRDGYAPYCKECKRAADRAWWARNKERGSVRNRKRYEANREYYIAQSAKWRSDNPERAKERHRVNELTRRARKREAFIEEVDPQTVYRMHGGMCGICKEFVSQDDFHVDHVIPLARGGEHGYINVQPAHPVCNIRKWAHV